MRMIMELFLGAFVVFIIDYAVISFLWFIVGIIIPEKDEGVPPNRDDRELYCKNCPNPGVGCYYSDNCPIP